MSMKEEECWAEQEARMSLENTAEDAIILEYSGSWCSQHWGSAEADADSSYNFWNENESTVSYLIFGIIEITRRWGWGWSWRWWWTVRLNSLLEFHRKLENKRIQNQSDFFHTHRATKLVFLYHILFLSIQFIGVYLVLWISSYTYTTHACIFMKFKFLT